MITAEQFGLLESGPTFNYWIYVPIGLTLASMLISVMAQYFSYFWPTIEIKPQFKNKTTHYVFLSYCVNHSLAAILTTCVAAYTYYYGSCYESNIFSMEPFEMMCYLMNVMWCTLQQVLIYDFLIYAFHRSCHTNKWMYIHIHKWHHENNTPNGVCDAIYGDAFEGTLVAYFGVGQMMFFSLPASSICLFLFLISFFVQLNHCGRKVRIPYVYTYKFHAVHHRHFKWNFAEHLPVWDFLFGTMKLNEISDEQF
ncbi:C-5 sterol desaturase-like protein [Naegleria gruberi]|uniref:C-5 sterol desaturase-like protein n=1 Tax=Naegleria gruberi TaxID=5762 RepID=D2VPD9_NAEGR|nr:C-5 sterol desaturase-like protein [Naegleria gruberi]EFC41342.1 C-5 sterol desaturase-like protein [Naegleria gruberi]|eukprot:XP_002674086.1 C-5 sterol desaturase-like protein [Naegleria gruberi strain NEG-M]